MIAKLLAFLRLARRGARMFFAARKKWANPAPGKIVVLDGGPSDVAVLVPLFKGLHYELVYTSGEEFYITPAIVLSMLRHIFKTRSLMAGYAISVLERIRPAIVVTFIDNSRGFQKTARHYKAARFLAIQNGARFLSSGNPAGSPVIHHSEFACLGQYDADNYTRHGAMVQKFYPIGSLKDSYYRSKRGAQPSAKHFDLCLVSQIKPRHYRVYPKTMASLDMLARHLRVFCERYGKTLCVAARRHPDRNEALFQWETEWFRERLGDLPQIIPNALEEYTSYSVIDSSRVSLAMHTTLLWEGFGRRNRILSCNYTGDPLYDFPVPGPWALSDPAYGVFESRLLFLLEMTDQEYDMACGDWPQYLIGYDEKRPTHAVLEELIADAVRGVPRPH
jgi:surface carbohydrate biosynthesis protein